MAATDAGGAPSEATPATISVPLPCEPPMQDCRCRWQAPQRISPPLPAPQTEFQLVSTPRVALVAADNGDAMVAWTSVRGTSWARHHDVNSGKWEDQAEVSTRTSLRMRSSRAETVRGGRRM